MRFKKKKRLGRKLKAGSKSAKLMEEQLRQYTLAKEAEAKVRNARASEVFTEVAKAAGENAYKVFSYNDWKAPKKERLRRLHAMYHGPKDTNKDLEDAVSKVLEEANTETQVPQE